MSPGIVVPFLSEFSAMGRYSLRMGNFLEGGTRTQDVRCFIAITLIEAYSEHELLQVADLQWFVEFLFNVNSADAESGLNLAFIWLREGYESEMYLC